MTDFSGEYETIGIQESGRLGNYSTGGEIQYGENMIGLPPHAEKNSVPFNELSLTEQIMTLDRVGSLLDKAGVNYSGCVVENTSMTKAQIGVFTFDEAKLDIPNKHATIGKAQVDMWTTFPRMENGHFMGGVENTKPAGPDVIGLHLAREGNKVFLKGSASEDAITALFSEHQNLLKNVDYDRRDGLKGETLHGYAVRISVE